MSITYKKLERAILKDMFLLPELQAGSSINPSEVMRDMKVALVPALRGAEKFIMCEDFEDMDEWNHYWEEIYHSALALREAGLFHLPYKTCYFESKFRETMRMKKGGWKLAKMVVDENFPYWNKYEEIFPIQETGHYPVYSEQVYMETFCCVAYENPETQMIKAVPFFQFYKDPTNHFTHYYRVIGINASKDGPLTGDYQGAFDDLISTPNSEISVVTSEHRATAYHLAIERLVISTIVMLHTKWAKKTRVYPLEMRLKPQLLKRAKPSDGHTTVTIRPPKTEDSEGTEGSGKPRHRMRLHLRRGHTREQPWGVGRKLVKSIYIEPTLVGYEEEGVITHDEYRVVK